MIVQEKISDNLIKTTSDCNLKIRQLETGIEYNSAVDIVPCDYTYEETTERVDEEYFIRHKSN